MMMAQPTRPAALFQPAIAARSDLAAAASMNGAIHALGLITIRTIDPFDRTFHDLFGHAVRRGVAKLSRAALFASALGTQQREGSKELLDVHLILLSCGAGVGQAGQLQTIISGIIFKNERP